MTGKFPMEAGSVWQKIKKIRWKRFLPLVLAILCLAAGVREFASMPRENALPVFLEGTYPDQNRAEEILNKKTEQADSREVCFYWDGGFIKVQDTEYGHQSEVYLAGLLGNARLYDWRMGGLAEEDHEGCVISRKTAAELFGTEAAAGNQLTVKGKTYTVRQVMPWQEKLLFIRPEETDTVYTRLFLKVTGDTGKKQAEQFLMENSLTGIFTAESLKDWIPDQWSDFSFWMEKWKEAGKNLQWYLMLPKTAVQTERIIYGFRGIAAVILSLLLYIWYKKKA